MTLPHLLVQAVKLWNCSGEQLAVCRTSTSLLHRTGSPTRLSFHPYRPLLAAGGGDHVVALYNLGSSARSNIEAVRLPPSTVS